MKRSAKSINDTVNATNVEFEETVRAAQPQPAAAPVDEKAETRARFGTEFGKGFTEAVNKRFGTDFDPVSGKRAIATAVCGIAAQFGMSYLLWPVVAFAFGATSMIFINIILAVMAFFLVLRVAAIASNITGLTVMSKLDVFIIGKVRGLFAGEDKEMPEIMRAA
jgi:hypothetical protein